MGEFADAYSPTGIGRRPVQSSGHDFQTEVLHPTTRSELMELERDGRSEPNDINVKIHQTKMLKLISRYGAVQY